MQEKEASTNKNQITQEPDRIRKLFLHGHNSHRRFLRERTSLQRLDGVPGFPRLLDSNEMERWLDIERLPGMALPDCEQIPDSCFISLRQRIDAMLAKGIARHSLPPRDILLLPDDNAAVVDFERVTLRYPGLGPLWHLAVTVTRFHLLRLIDDHAPHLLSAVELQRLQRLKRIRKWLQPLKNLQRRYTPS